MLDLAGKVRQLLAVTGNKVLTGVVRIIEDPSAFVRPYIAEVGKMIAAVPGKAAGLYDQHIAPLFGGGGAPAARSAVQRQPDGDAATALSPGSPIPAGPTRGAIIKDYLGQRLTTWRATGAASSSTRCWRSSSRSCRFTGICPRR